MELLIGGATAALPLAWSRLVVREREIEDSWAIRCGLLWRQVGWRGPPEGAGTPAERMGARVAQSASQALQGRSSIAGGLGYAAVEFGLPRAQVDNAVPGFLRRPAANILHLLAPRRAQLAVVRLPGLSLLCVPAEPTAEAARILRERIGALTTEDEAIAIVSLAQGYVGYAEAPAAVREGRGEAKRVLFEPELLERIAQALEVGFQGAKAATL